MRSKVLERIRGVEEILYDIIASLNQEINTSKGILGVWDQMENIDLDALIACDTIPSSHMFYVYQGLMGHKEVLGKLLTKLQGALEGYQIVETEIMCDLEQMGCNVCIEHDNLFIEEEMTSEYTDKVNVYLD